MHKVSKKILLIILPWMLLITSCRPLTEPHDETGPTMPNETSQTIPTEGTQVGELAPDFQLQNLDGQDISLSNPPVGRFGVLYV